MQGRADDRSGSVIVAANTVLTGLFGISTLLAAALFDQPWRAVAVVVDIVCFAIGVVAFLWGYWNAVQRSREEEIGVAALYFLLDGIAPRTVVRRMNAMLAFQTVWAVVTAVWRGSTNGKPGSTLAFGILVPMLGLGLNGLWGAFHGTFGPRVTREQHGVSRGDDGNGQD